MTWHRPHDDGCEHCSEGWVSIVETTNGRVITFDTFVVEKLRTNRAAETGEPAPAVDSEAKRYVVRCLCAAGQKRTKHVKAVTHVLSPADISAMWPKGTPSSANVTEDDLKDANVPFRCLHWTIDTFEKHPPLKKDPDAQKYAALAREWIAGGGARSDVVIFGPNGTGKTGIGIAMLHGILAQHMTASFIAARELLLQIRDTYRPDADASELGVLQKFVEPYLLVLDEVSGVKASDASIDTLVLLVDKRQKAGRPTIYTMNLGSDLGPQEATKEIATFVGPTLFDRLRERASFWAMFGKSKRSTNRKLVDIDDFRNQQKETAK
jgi:DNA replication protein DnaC